MNIESAIQLLELTIKNSLLLIGPILATTMVVGLAVSLIQAVTSIQEQTLSFVPKLVAVGLVMIVSSHWLIRTLMQFTISVIQRIPDITR